MTTELIKALHQDFSSMLSISNGRDRVVVVGVTCCGQYVLWAWLFMRMAFLDMVFAGEVCCGCDLCGHGVFWVWCLIVMAFMGVVFGGKVCCGHGTLWLWCFKGMHFMGVVSSGMVCCGSGILWVWCGHGDVNTSINPLHSQKSTSAKKCNLIKTVNDLLDLVSCG